MLSRTSLSELLEAVAARRPAPGGGSSAAWTCAVAAGLVAMAARFTIDRRGAEALALEMVRIRDRADELRGAALELAERDLKSYAPVLEAMRLERDDPARDERVRAALAQAAEVPLEIVRLGATVAEMAVDVASRGNPNVRGDALSGALLAESACQAAACLVRIDLADVAADDPRLRELDTLLARAGTARVAALR